uniref:Uncharacterized protein n=1 Tax=Anopheles stephensi TaxID=30069 RepID=A0A182YMT5_ANOST
MKSQASDNGSLKLHMLDTYFIYSHERNGSFIDSSWSMYLWVTLIAALSLGLFFALFRLIRRKKTIPAYNLARSVCITKPAESKSSSQ